MILFIYQKYTNVFLAYLSAMKQIILFHFTQTALSTFILTTMFIDLLLLTNFTVGANILKYTITSFVGT